MPIRTLKGGYIVSENLKAIGTCKRADCIYYAKNTKSCDYRLVHGQGRGCAADSDCDKYEKGKGKQKIIYN